MKKWIITLSFVILVFFIADSWLFNSKTVSEGQLLYTPIQQHEVKKGSLVLINKQHAISEGHAPTDLVALSDHSLAALGFETPDSSITISSTLLQNVSSLFNAAKKDDVTGFKINSSYRSTEQQQALFETFGENYALPAGHSEHHLGLALDIGSHNGSMDESEEGKWLHKNAWKYGFILRYPADKVAVTGIEYEAWHFRYVGLPHSAVMQQENWVLEEYLAYLKEHGSYEARVNKRDYTIRYYEVFDNLEVPIYSGMSYQISGDNQSGVIVTSEH